MSPLGPLQNVTNFELSTQNVKPFGDVILAKIQADQAQDAPASVEDRKVVEECSFSIDKLTPSEMSVSIAGK